MGGFKAVEHRQQQRLTRRQAMEMAGIRLGGQVDDRVDLSQGALGLLGVGIGAVEIAPQAEQRVHSIRCRRLDQGAGVIAGLATQGPAQQLLQRQPHRLPQLGRHPHRAKTLHVGMAANRHRAGPGPAHIAAQYGGIGYCLHVVDAVAVVGDAHRPGEYHAAGVGDLGGGMVQFLTAETAAIGDLLPTGIAQLLDQGLPAIAVVFHKLPGDGIPFQQCLLQPQKYCRVGAGNRLQKEGGNLRVLQHRANWKGG